MRLPNSRRNQKYQRNHMTIQKVILNLTKNPRKRFTVLRVAKETRLSKQTLYAHYTNIYNAPEEIKKEISKSYGYELKDQYNSLAKVISDNNERLFYIMMIFMAHNKDIFIPICNNLANHTILFEMMKITFPHLSIIWFPLNAPSPIIGSEKADMYLNMCVEILSRWGSKTKCNIHKSRRYVRRLLILTSEASMRCK